jgi:hypothetical protein
MFSQQLIAGKAAFIAALAATIAVPAAVRAQDSSSCSCVVISRKHEPNEFQRRSSGALSFIQSRPSGALARNIGFGYGVDGTYLFRLDRAGYLSLRADAGVLQYGSESKHVPLSPTVGGRIQVKVSTNNQIVPLSIGPQLMWPRGSVRPYVNAGVGGQFFYTQSGIEGSDDSFEFARTTNQWDKTALWLAGGGVYLPVYERNVKVSIDLGAQFVTGGRARYLKPGSIQDLPDGTIQISPMESETHMTLVRLGVRIGL